MYIHYTMPDSVILRRVQENYRRVTLELGAEADIAQADIMRGASTALIVLRAAAVEFTHDQFVNAMASAAPDGGGGILGDANPAVNFPEPGDEYQPAPA